MSVTATINRQAALHIVRRLHGTYEEGASDTTLAALLLDWLKEFDHYGEPRPALINPNSAAAEILADSLVKIAIANRAPGLKTSWANIGEVRVSYYPKSQRHAFWDRLGQISKEQAIKNLTFMVANL